MIIKNAGPNIDLHTEMLSLQKRSFIARSPFALELAAQDYREAVIETSLAKAQLCLLHGEPLDIEEIERAFAKRESGAKRLAILAGSAFEKSIGRAECC